MDKIIVKNYQTTAGQLNGQNENQFLVKSIIDDITKCSANFVEVDPGKIAYGYHFHEENEEIFYIISGEALVKTENGEIHLKTGDVICFPANINGSHVISNPSKTEKLIYLDVGTANKPDIIHFTGTNIGMVVSNNGVLKFTE